MTPKYIMIPNYISKNSWKSTSKICSMGSWTYTTRNKSIEAATIPRRLL